MAVRMIRKFEDEILRKRCREVEAVDERVRQILGDMADTLYDTPGAGGLAACQVGLLKRLVVIDLGEGLLQLVNPVLVEAQGEQVVSEGCLSFPGVWGKVRRPAYVKVRALNERGEPCEVEGRGMLAKCLCHELDHLEGIVFTDKMLEEEE